MPLSSLVPVQFPPRVPIPRQPTLLSHTIKQCARLSISLFYTSLLCTSSLMSWFTKNAPKAHIAGLDLTRTTATTLLQICRTLLSTLETQTEDIRFIPRATETYLPITLSEIQTRHETLTETLKNLVYSFQQHGFQEAWMAELGDALTSMERKERRCWLESTAKLGMGWKAAAVLYWPLIAERYEPVFDVVTAFKWELDDAVGDEMTWGGGARRRRRSLVSVKSVLKGSLSGKSVERKGKQVVFDERVRWRGFGAMDAPDDVGGLRRDKGGKLCEGEFTTKLRQHGGSSTDEFRRRAVEVRRVHLLIGWDWKKENLIAWGEGKGDEDDDDDEDDDEDDQDDDQDDEDDDQDDEDDDQDDEDDDEEEKEEDGGREVGEVKGPKKEVGEEPVKEPVKEPVEGPVQEPVQEPVKEPTAPPRQERIKRAPRRRNLLF